MTDTTGVVLVVDDDHAMRQLIAFVLRAAGHTVQTAHNGQEALTLLGGLTGTRLIISDLDMPGMNGYSLLQQVKAENGPPMLIITARGEQAAEERALALGASGVLHKPFSRQQLLRAAESYMIEA